MIKKKVYVQALEVINQTNILKEKIPREVLRKIRKNAIGGIYKFEYDNKKDIIEQIDRETLSFITYLFLTYAANEEEKNKIKEILIKNEIEYKKILK